MVSVLDSLVHWFKDMGGVNTSTEAMTAANTSTNASANGHVRDTSSDLGSIAISSSSPHRQEGSTSDSYSDPSCPDQFNCRQLSVTRYRILC